MCVCMYVCMYVCPSRFKISVDLLMDVARLVCNILMLICLVGYHVLFHVSRLPLNMRYVKSPVSWHAHIHTLSQGRRRREPRSLVCLCVDPFPLLSPGSALQTLLPAESFANVFFSGLQTCSIEEGGEHEKMAAAIDPLLNSAPS